MSEKQNAIVERLRKYDMHEGADEIERLRAALNGIVEAARFTQGLPEPLAEVRGRPRRTKGSDMTDPTPLRSKIYSLLATQAPRFKSCNG